MPLRLKNIVPLYLETEKIARSEIWDRDVSIEDGARVQICAPSGSGKTSMVHFIYGLRGDYSGEMQVAGRDLKGFSADEVATLRAKNISIVFQDLRLFADVSVEENISVKRNLARYHVSSRIAEMAARLGIENKLSQKAGLCSYGEQQRVAIIRALQQPFDFLVLDEPFSHLDEANSRLAMELIEEEVALRKAAIVLADLQQVPFFTADKTYSRDQKRRKNITENRLRKHWKVFKTR